MKMYIRKTGRVKAIATNLQPIWSFDFISRFQGNLTSQELHLNICTHTLWHFNEQVEVCLLFQIKVVNHLQVVMLGLAILFFPTNVNTFPKCSLPPIAFQPRISLVFWSYTTLKTDPWKTGQRGFRFLCKCLRYLDGGSIGKDEKAFKVRIKMDKAL